jgi:hypothetical protein
VLAPRSAGSVDLRPCAWKLLQALHPITPHALDCSPVPEAEWQAEIDYGAPGIGRSTYMGAK